MRRKLLMVESIENGMKMLKHLTHISLDEDIDSDVVVATVISVFLAGNPVDFLLPFTAAAATDLLDRRGSLQEKEVVPEVPRGVVLVRVVGVPDLLRGHLHHGDHRRQKDKIR